MSITVSSPTDEEVLAQVRQGRSQADAVRQTEPRATVARYSVAKRVLVLALSSGVRLEVPVALLPELSGATRHQLRAVTVSPSGAGLRWEGLDMDLDVSGLLVRLLGSGGMRVLAATGGKVSSEAKREAARRNGARGGRPRNAVGTG